MLLITTSLRPARQGREPRNKRRTHLTNPSSGACQMQASTDAYRPHAITYLHQLVSGTPCCTYTDPNYVKHSRRSQHERTLSTQISVRVICNTLPITCALMPASSANRKPCHGCGLQPPKQTHKPRHVDPDRWARTSCSAQQHTTAWDNPFPSPDYGTAQHMQH